MKILIFSFFLLSNFTYAKRFVVEAKYPLKSSELKKIENIKIYPFTSLKHPYFSRLYSVSGNITKNELKKLKWVKTVEKTPELMRFSLLPSEKPERVVSDELFPYQWALLNQGQSYVREKDDIHNLPLKGVDGKDIGWKSIFKQIPKEKVIVAVLDSGVDLEHPDLKDNLWKNESECGKDPEVDHDNNKLSGDCHGWNFTEAIDSVEAKNPKDIDGHGTHVAGIIAAGQNGIGIVGVNPYAQIMPVKVMRDAQSRSEIATSESFAQGIIYATNMGAKIINLSLGWPRSLETKFLREAIYYALSKNVIIVAAAGNNNSSEPLYPCAYDGVICTAASTLDGNFAGFSNYGGHVDALTPGEAILSLNPMTYEPDFFSVPGYDIKSGTSQAAPMLAGMISILRAQNPEMSIDEVFGRIYSTRSPMDKKYVLGGVTSWDNLSRPISHSIIRPILKRVRQLVLSHDRLDTKLLVSFRNYGIETKNIQIKLESLSPSVDVLSDVIKLDLFRQSEVIDLNFLMRVTDLSAESNLKIKITVTSEEGTHVYFNELPVVRDVRGDKEFKKLSFTFAGDVLPIGNITNGKIQPFIRTVDTYGKNDKHEFYLRRVLKDEKKLELTVFEKKGSSFIQRPKQIVLDDFVSLVNFIRVDLNLDGKDDYLLQTVQEINGEKFFQFSFYDSEMNALWSDFQNVRPTVDILIKQLGEINFIQLDHSKLGKMLVPAFFSEGQLPKADQQKDFFGNWDGSKENRLYYLMPQFNEKTFQIRTLTTPEWKEKVKKDLKSKWFETVSVENILPPSTTDVKKGVVRVLVSVGQGTKRQILIATFDTKNTARGNPLPQLVLQSENVDPLYTISPSGLDSVGDVYFNIYDRSRGKVVTTVDMDQKSQINYTHKSDTDFLSGHIVSFDNGAKRLTILQTRDELISLSSAQGKVTQSSRPKLRYSFFSAKVLSQMYFPVIYNRSNHQFPGLYVDSTAVTHNRVYVLEDQNGHLISSMRNSLLVPSNCNALNPAYSFESKTNEFVFLCFEDKEWVVRAYHMK